MNSRISFFFVGRSSGSFCKKQRDLVAILEAIRIEKVIPDSA